MKPLVLTEGQQGGVNDLQTLLLDPKQLVHIIEGYSGTGKSTLVKHFLDTMNSIIQGIRLLNPAQQDIEVHATATTKPACESLQTIIKREVKTIHSTLGFTVQNNYRTGKPELVDTGRISFEIDSTKEYLFIIDEASYINQKLWNMIINKLKKLGINFKLILIGDPYQLIDLMSKDAHVFQLGFKTTYLTEVKRNDSLIRQVSLQFRNTVKTGEYFSIEPDGDSIMHVDRDTLEQMMVDSFNDPNWTHEHSKYLAYKNAKVVDYNQRIAHVLKGRMEMQPGDYVINNRYTRIGGHALSNNALVYVNDVIPDTHYGVPGNVVTVNGLTGFMPDDYTMQKKVADQLRKEGDMQGVKEVTDTWLDLRHAYCSTVHKAQGASYHTVFIDLDNISECKNKSYMARLLYVATSRARKRVVYCGDIA